MCIKSQDPEARQPAFDLALLMNLFISYILILAPLCLSFLI